jgi:hypothetical protein
MNGRTGKTGKDWLVGGRGLDDPLPLPDGSRRGCQSRRLVPG